MTAVLAKRGNKVESNELRGLDVCSRKASIVKQNLVLNVDRASTTIFLLLYRRRVYNIHKEYHVE
jgi:hypothetical protein